MPYPPAKSEAQVFAEPGRSVLAAAASSHEMVLGACGPTGRLCQGTRPPGHGLLQAGIQPGALWPHFSQSLRFQPATSL